MGHSGVRAELLHVCLEVLCLGWNYLAPTWSWQYTQFFLECGVWLEQRTAVGPAPLKTRYPDGGHPRMARQEFKQKHLAPCVDIEIDMSTVRAQDRDDPRAKGEGPCGEKHLDPLNLRAEDLVIEDSRWGQNQWARWVACEKCALRLGYWSKHGASGRYREQVGPEVVKAALRSMKQDGHWSDSTYAMVKGYIKKEENRRRMLTQAMSQNPSGPKDLTKKGAGPSSSSMQGTAKERTKESLEQKGQDQTMVDASMEELKEAVAELKRENKKLLQKVEASGAKSKSEEP